MSEAPADTKPDTNHINIKVASSNAEVFFRIKRTTPLGKLMNSYCERQNVSRNQVRFMLDGKRIQEHNTPEEVI